MASRKKRPTCLSCKHYRPTDQLRGRCRLNKGRVDPAVYPVMDHEDRCDAWLDVGQKYHIRIGWVRGLKDKSTVEAKAEMNEDK